MLGRSTENENKSTATNFNNPMTHSTSLSLSSYPTSPTIRQKRPSSIPEYTKTAYSFFNSNVMTLNFNKSPIDLGLDLAWKTALGVGIAYASIPVAVAVFCAIKPALIAGGVAFTFGCVGKFAYDQHEERTKTRKGPAP